MSGNPNPTLSDIEENERVSHGPDIWTIEAVDAPADRILLERYDSETIPFPPRALGRCSCGVLTVGEAPCYGCYLESGARTVAGGGARG